MTASLIVPDFQSITKNLPHLAERDRWLVWNFETVGGRLTKPPRSAKTGATINVKDAKQLVSFEEARAAYESGGFSGVGYSLDDGDVALDLDQCRNPETGEIDSWAFEIFEQAKSYCELTPSETGARVIGTGAGPTLNKNLRVPDSGANAHLEIYRSADRYITVTGLQIAEYEHCTPRNIDAVADGLLQRFGGKATSTTLEYTMPPGDLPLPDEDDLDPAMLALLHGGAPQGHRSETFHQVVTGLRDIDGLIPAQIETVMRRYPNGIASKYNGRLRKAIEASWQKVRGDVCDVRREENGDIIDYTNGQVLYSESQPNGHSPQGDDPEPVMSNRNDDWINLIKTGVVGELADLIVNSSMMPQPGMSALAALSIVATLAGRQLRTPEKRGQLHLFTVSVAATSSGKGDPLGAIKWILGRIGLPELATNWPASTAALYEIADRYPVSIIPVDEFGSVLQSISGKGAPSHVQELKATLRELYDGKYLMSRHAKSNPGIVCGEPCVGIFAVTTPSQFYDALSNDDAESGTLNRFLMINGVDDPRIRWETPDLRVSDDLKAHLLAIANRPGASNGDLNYARFRIGPATPQRGAYSVPWADSAARDNWRAYVESVHAKSLGDATQSYYAGRCGQNALRVATILAIGENSAEPRVSLDNVRAGIALADASLATLTEGLIANIKKAPEAGKRHKILEFIKRHGGSATAREVKRIYGDSFKELARTVLNPLVAAGRLIKAPTSRKRAARQKGTSQIWLGLFEQPVGCG
jgi:Protein of unknown function (DUF3987)